MDPSTIKSIINYDEMSFEDDDSKKRRIERIKCCLRKARKGSVVDEIEGRLRERLGEKLKKMKESLGAKNTYSKMDLNKNTHQWSFTNETEGVKVGKIEKNDTHKKEESKNDDEDKLKLYKNIESEYKEMLLRKNVKKFRIPTFDFCKNDNIFKSIIYRPKSKFLKNKHADGLTNLPELVECSMKLNNNTCSLPHDNISSHSPPNLTSFYENVVQHTCANEHNIFFNGNCRDFIYEKSDKQAGSFSGFEDNDYSTDRQDILSLDIIANIDDNSSTIKKNITQHMENNETNLLKSTSNFSNTQINFSNTFSMVTQISKLENIYLTSPNYKS